MNISVLIKDLRKKWKIYVIGYLIGYIIYIISNGAPTWHYYFPIKALGVGVSLTLGSLLDDDLIKSSHLEKKWKSLKFTVMMAILIISAYLLKSLILILTGYDISPLVGF